MNYLLFIVVSVVRSVLSMIFYVSVKNLLIVIFFFMWLSRKQRVWCWFSNIYQLSSMMNWWFFLWINCFLEILHWNNCRLSSRWKIGKPLLEPIQIMVVLVLKKKSAFISWFFTLTIVIGNFYKFNVKWKKFAAQTPQYITLVP